MTLSGLGSVVGDRLGRSGTAVGLLAPVYASCLRRIYGRRGLPWHVNGEPVRIDPSVRHLVPHENERPLFEFMRSHVRRGDVVLDIGAFLGIYAVMAARWTGESGRVLAFEPSPGSFAVLLRHLAMNGLDAGSVQAHCAAVGAREERGRLMTFADEPYRNMMAVPEASGPGVGVDIVTVDEVCARLGRPPDWIRMDVQGLEFEVLRGAREVLGAAGADLTIVAEMHPEQWPDYGVEPRDAVERFAEFGLRARPVEPRRPAFEQGAHVILEPLDR